MAQQKEFLALNHGEEWVEFYESFDKLVQDNLARSSELLKRAMALPDVADREVAKLKDELEGKLQVEQNRHKSVLAQLRDEIDTSHGAAATLSRSLNSIVADLERLSGRVAEALSSFDAVEGIQDSLAGNGTLNGASHDSPNGSANGSTNGTSDAHQTDSAETSDEPAARLPDLETTPEEPGTGMSSDVTGALESLAAELDVMPIVEGEPLTLDVPENTSDAPSERPRPHWLSVSRVGVKN